MSKNRTPRDRDQRPVISVEALAAWRACKQIKRRGSDEYRDAVIRLNHSVGLSKFDVSPAEVGARPPAYLTQPERRPLLEEWHQARRWRDALERADREAAAAK